MKNNTYPFTAVIGQNDFKLSLLLTIIDPSIGGVLVVGDKGTGKTTLIRSLAALMKEHQNFSFVNLPIGASEDRVLGHINLEKLINNKQEQVVPGLLAKANKGILYIDEVNLLNDYLMDVLLDAAASGGYYLEREGLSKYLESKFCLIGSMNPEEGNVRPQLKDRFGLSVFVRTNTIAAERLQIIKNRMSFDDDASLFVKSYAEKEIVIYNNIKKAKKILNTIVVTDEIYIAVTNLVLEHKVEGHRADILLIKTARAYAAYLGDSTVTIHHLETIKDFVLNHRSNIDEPKQEPQNNNSEEQKKEEKQEDSIANTQVFKSVLPSMNFTKTNNKQSIASKKGERVVGKQTNSLNIVQHQDNFKM